jgi:hypothetical protein
LGVKIKIQYFDNSRILNRNVLKLNPVFFGHAIFGLAVLPTGGDPGVTRGGDLRARCWVFFSLSLSVRAAYRAKRG